MKRMAQEQKNLQFRAFCALLSLRLYIASPHTGWRFYIARPFQDWRFDIQLGGKLRWRQRNMWNVRRVSGQVGFRPISIMRGHKNTSVHQKTQKRTSERTTVRTNNRKQHRGKKGENKQERKTANKHENTQESKQENVQENKKRTIKKTNKRTHFVLQWARYIISAQIYGSGAIHSESTKQ